MHGVIIAGSQTIDGFGVGTKMQRRAFITLLTGAVACGLAPSGLARSGDWKLSSASSMPPKRKTTLLTAEIEVAGDWGRMLEGAADQVLERMRLACIGRCATSLGPPAETPSRGGAHVRSAVHLVAPGR